MDLGVTDKVRPLIAAATPPDRGDTPLMPFPQWGYLTTIAVNGYT